jgi:hypothetical protein
MSITSTGNGKRSQKPKTRDLRGWPLEWLRVATPEEAEQLSSLSWKTIKREHADKIVHLSKRRDGMRVGDCLMLAD